MSHNGIRYWGRYGSAGLLLWAPQPDGMPAVLLQHRARWSHHGGTWGLPGGARDSHETAVQTALREAREEAGLAVDQIRVRATTVTAAAPGTQWAYVTVVADADHLLPVRPNVESLELRWVTENEVAGLPLHPGLAANWGSCAPSTIHPTPRDLCRPGTGVVVWPDRGEHRSWRHHKASLSVT